MYKLITRADAIEQGLTTYFTGKPCMRGHVVPRKVGNGNCTECGRLLTKRWREEGKSCEMYKAKEMPTLEYLDECFSVEGGVLHWKARPSEHFATLRGWAASNTAKTGKPAGHINKRHGYIEVRVDGKLFKAHRLIFKLHYRFEPEFIVDHIDGDVSNNSPNNLREATSMENSRNSDKRTKIGTSEYKGVLYHKNSWHSTITIQDVSVIIPAESEYQAALDYDRRAKEAFGEFAKLNFN